MSGDVTLDTDRGDAGFLFIRTYKILKSMYVIQATIMYPKHQGAPLPLEYHIDVDVDLSVPARQDKRHGFLIKSRGWGVQSNGSLGL